MNIYIGIDDTDNLDTRGTGYQARALGGSLMEAGLVRLQTVTRHQLLVDSRIPFTSHNSSACLFGELTGNLEDVIVHSREFLVRESAPDSDAGLCIIAGNRIPEEVVRFGQKAKVEVVQLEEAVSIAKKHYFYLEGFLNTRIGMIGSLAAVGLRHQGEDGRLLWMENLRETQGVFRAMEYLELIGIECIVEPDGSEVDEKAMVHISDWSRPVMNRGKITLFVEKTENNALYDYQSASKEFIKSISE